MNVTEQINQKVASNYSVDKYMGNLNVWDTLAKELPNLTALGLYSLKVDGRIDIASYDLYEDPMLDWVLLLYNKIKRIGTNTVSTIKKVLPLSIDARDGDVYDRQTYDLGLAVGNFEVISNGDTIPTYQDPQGNTYADVDQDSVNDLYIEYGTRGATVITNTSLVDIDCSIAYTDRSVDNTLAKGYQLAYPSQSDIDTLLARVLVENQEQVSGFSRL